MEKFVFAIEINIWQIQFNSVYHIDAQILQIQYYHNTIMILLIYKGSHAGFNKTR